MPAPVNFSIIGDCMESAEEPVVQIVTEFEEEFTVKLNNALQPDQGPSGGAYPSHRHHYTWYGRQGVWRIFWTWSLPADYTTTPVEIDSIPWFNAGLFFLRVGFDDGWVTLPVSREIITGPEHNPQLVKVSPAGAGAAETEIFQAGGVECFQSGPGLAPKYFEVYSDFGEIPPDGFSHTGVQTADMIAAGYPEEYTIHVRGDWMGPLP